MGAFEIVQLSDLHFAQAPLPTGWSYLRSWAADQPLVGFDLRQIVMPACQSEDVASLAAEFAHRQCQSADLLLVSGDLATTGMRDDLLAARSYVLDPVRPGTVPFVSRSGRPTLQGCGAPVFLMPGNHDRYRSVYAEPGAEIFDEVFSGHWPSGKRVHAATITDPAGSRLTLIAADFSLRSEREADDPALAYRYGQGSVHGDVLDELVRRTRIARRESGAAVIWVSHFPPSDLASGPAGLLALKNWGWLLEEARAEGIGHILAGHLHVCDVFDEEGGVKVMAAGSATAAQHQSNWIHRLLVATDGPTIRSVTRIDYVLDHVTPNFAIALRDVPG